MLNITNEALNWTSQQILQYSADNLLPSMIFYWVVLFAITLFVGLFFIEKDKANFWAIFIFTQLVGLLILFFIFVIPIIPQWLSNMGFTISLGGKG